MYIHIPIIIECDTIKIWCGILFTSLKEVFKKAPDKAIINIIKTKARNLISLYLSKIVDKSKNIF